MPPLAQRLPARQLNALLLSGAKRAEKQHLDALVRAYLIEIDEAADMIGNRFALTAAADWQPQPEGALLTPAMLGALTSSLNERLIPIWTKLVLETAGIPLARVEIAWDVKHPLAEALIQNAGKRTGARLGEAVQFTLRRVVSEAYNEGLDVRATTARIRTEIRGAAPAQAEMLARTDLNSLANGASKAAATLTGMNYKSWQATLDDKTRPEHVEAHGQTVPINQPFTVGGEDADYPGDPNLSDEQAANCRCTLVYGETLAESEGFVAAAHLSSDQGGTIMGDMTTRQRARKAARRKGKPTGTARLAAGGASAVSLVASPKPIPFEGVAAIEGKVADDNSLAPRVILPGALTWAEMPRALMAQTVTAEGHDGAEVAGRIDEFGRKKGTGRMNSITFNGDFTTPFGINEIAPMVEDQTMRYVSIDMGAMEVSLVDRKTFDIIEDQEFDLSKAEAGGYALGITTAKIKAATIVPTQAIEGAMIALVASADTHGIGVEKIDDDTFRVVVPIEMTLGAGDGLTAAASAWAPPREWFETPEPPGKMPLTITKDGRVYGHLATWDSCHAQFLPSCVPPPRSPSNYARFHTGTIDLADGSEIMVGKLMFSVDGGHANTRLNAVKAAQHYDRTGREGAYLRAIDGQHGIWVCGSINPRLTDEQRNEMRRELRLNPPSGDWRPYPEGLDLLCGLAVAVPGFAVNDGGTKVTIVASADGIQIEDAIIASSGWFDADDEAIAALEHAGIVDDDLIAERRMRALAARSDGLDALAALVD